ncbi:hypothetical protein L596_015473 [Steinernema carpocapsae]|uniref:Uncharacterized protein n=1 Tax=Steinernema carpocapsae TaxID=34508 RepID=A0A4U5NFZ3_STECR|nr:hypothetical protein L596_015473 [Steinernema carpocapsae]
MYKFEKTSVCCSLDELDEISNRSRALFVISLSVDGRSVVLIMGATQNGVECVELPDGRVVVKKKTTRKHEKERSEDDLKIALKEAAYASTKALAAAEAAVKAAVFAAEAVRRAEEISGYAVVRLRQS